LAKACVKVETRIANHHDVKEGENHKVKFFSSKMVWKVVLYLVLNFHDHVKFVKAKFHKLFQYGD
jgi:hypothetical protein